MHQATLLWHLGLRQTDIRLLVRREYMSMFAVSASTLQRRLRFLHDEVNPMAARCRCQNICWAG